MLNSCRQTGMNAQLISFTDIKSYIEFYDIDDVERFIIYIKRMDAEYVNTLQEKNNN